jgi:transposase
MRSISEIFRLHHECKLSHHNIARSLKISSSTVSLYLNKARKAGLSWPLPEMSNTELYAKLFPSGIGSRSFEEKKPMPNWEMVMREMRRKGVTLQLLWQEFIQTNPNGISYSRMCFYYRHYLKNLSPVMRQTHKAGEKAFVDYAGMTMEWLSLDTGEVKEAQIFVGCLGASQLTFAEAVESQGLPHWIASNIRMFEFFGGVSEILVPDNLKSGVTNSHCYDPDINTNFQLFGEHYGVAIVPARPSSPRDKAKVENAVGCVERQILAKLRDQTFTSIAEINAAIKPLLKNFNHQPLQKMDVSRWQLYETIDLPALKSLPARRFEYAQWKKARVNIDYHFTFDHHHYSVPFRYIQKKVEIRATINTIECFFDGERIASHVRSNIRNGHTTIADHMPPAHAAQAEWTPERIQYWAAKTGVNTAKFIGHMIASRAFPQQAFRACLGVLRLGKAYGDERLEKACEHALALGFTRYKQIETMLKNRMENIAQANEEDAPLPVHSNIRGSHYYH